MASNLAKLLDGATQAFQTGVESRAQGDTDGARSAFLLAAEKLFQAAKASSGRLRETRTHLAQEMLAEAQALKDRRPVRGQGRQISSTPAKPIPLGEDDEAKTWLVHERPDVTFDDIAGLGEVKEQIRLKLLYPFTHPEIAAQYDIQAGGGILLYGPPGTGKTLIARAMAGEIEAAFFTLKPSEIMSQWVGVAEQNLQQLFAEANGYPISVIFMDEMEALAPKRRTSGSTVMQRVVPQLLAELDGFHKRQNALLFIGATNEPWAIDGAILRPGRLDRLIYVPPPDTPARQRILELNLREVPLSEDVDLSTVATRTQGFSGADMAALARRARERVFTEAVHQGLARPIAMPDFLTVLEEMGPSIPEKDLKKFDQFVENRR